MVQPPWKTAWQFLQNLNVEWREGPAIPQTHTKKSTPMFILTWIIKTEKQKPPRRPSADEQVNQMWSLHRMEYYAISKRNDVLMRATAWMNPENTTWNEGNWSQKTIYCMIPWVSYQLVSSHWYWYWYHTNVYHPISTIPLVDSVHIERLVVTWGWRKGRGNRKGLITEWGFFLRWWESSEIRRWWELHWSVPCAALSCSLMSDSLRPHGL